MNDDDVDGNVLKVSSFDDQHKSRSHQQPEERTQPQCHTAAHPLQLKLQPPPSIPPVTDMTSPMTKTEIIEEFARLGELPPKSWSHTECLFRMEELRAQGLTANPRAKSKTPLQLKMTQLNAVSRKKCDLVKFCQELQVPLSGHETIPILQKKATQTLLEVRGYGSGSSRIRHPRGSQLPGDQDERTKLCTMGDHHLQRVDDHLSSAGSLGTVADQRVPEDSKARVHRDSKPASNPKEVLVEKGYIKTSNAAKAAPSAISKQSGASSSNMTGVTSTVLKAGQPDLPCKKASPPKTRASR